MGNGIAGVSELVETWRQIIIGDHKSWVLFAHGTCVVLAGPAEDLAGQATGILRVYGPVHPGSPTGDFDGRQPGRTPPARVKAVMQARPKECHDHLAAGVLRPSGLSAHRSRLNDCIDVCIRSGRLSRRRPG